MATNKNKNVGATPEILIGRRKINEWVDYNFVEKWIRCYNWYQSKPLPVRYGPGKNQAEAGGYVTPPLGGHVTLEADEGGERSGSWQLLGKTESYQNEMAEVVEV
ncbi:hypothetical protein MTR_4g072920 [Medicago truncatula]|uniref:Uncharacterized protein n=1 Tax=Medicago truncatula TaxID=3880 RepID=G7JMB7_MEDTR|nr:hypothetical protein MTR_4g072920 [Medicago truncatula]